VGAGVTITAEARATLTEAIDAAVDWPVFDTRPPTEALPTPCVYVDIAARRAADDDGAPVTVVTFPVVAIVDGGDDEQCRALDDIGDTIWDVVRSLDGGGVSATPADADVGGPRLRSLITLVDVVVERPTMCPPVEVNP
jgi:hypothetical protein